jgi:hypothetical protein
LPRARAKGTSDLPDEPVYEPALCKNARPIRGLEFDRRGE